MEEDVVHCSQNAMFVLPRKMLKILYQLCIWSTSVRNVVYIMPVYVDTIKILGTHILCLPFYSVPLFCITKSISKKYILKANCSCTSCRVLMTDTAMHCITYCNSRGLVIQVVILERYVLQSK